MLVDADEFGKICDDGDVLVSVVVDGRQPGQVAVADKWIVGQVNSWAT